MLDLEGEDFLATDDHGFLHTPKDSIHYPGLSLCRFCENLEHQLKLQGSGRARSHNLKSGCETSIFDTKFG
jgi:hypothetical protein